MVYDTVRLLPPRLARVLLERNDAILAGVVSLEGETASALARGGQAGVMPVELLADLDVRVNEIARMVSEHRPLDEVASAFGRLLRIAADMADPAIVGSGSPEFRRVVREYYRFVELNVSKFPLVHDAALPSPVYGATLQTLVERIVSDTSSSVPALAAAFWSNGRIVSASTFDFRSVPYAETSLGYSRAVTAASYFWLSAWARANGDFTGYRFGNGKQPVKEPK